MSWKIHVFDVLYNLRNSARFHPKNAWNRISGTLDFKISPPRRSHAFGVRFAPPQKKWRSGYATGPMYRTQRVRVQFSSPSLKYFESKSKMIKYNQSYFHNPQELNASCRSHDVFKDKAVLNFKFKTWYIVQRSICSACICPNQINGTLNLKYWIP